MASWVWSHGVRRPLKSFAPSRAAIAARVKLTKLASPLTSGSTEKRRRCWAVAQHRIHASPAADGSLTISSILAAGTPVARPANRGKEGPSNRALRARHYGLCRGLRRAPGVVNTNRCATSVEPFIAPADGIVGLESWRSPTPQIVRAKPSGDRGASETHETRIAVDLWLNRETSALLGGRTTPYSRKPRGRRVFDHFIDLGRGDARRPSSKPRQRRTFEPGPSGPTLWTLPRFAAGAGRREYEPLCDLRGTFHRSSRWHRGSGVMAFADPSNRSRQAERRSRRE